jgi:hypothetical protein
VPVSIRRCCTGLGIYGKIWPLVPDIGKNNRRYIDDQY